MPVGLPTLSGRDERRSVFAEKNERMPNARQRLQHIVKFGEEAMGFVAGVSREAFLANETLQMASRRCIDIVARASAAITEDHQAFARGHKTIPWGRAVNLLRRYDEVTPEEDWDILREDLPVIVGRVRAGLARLNATLSRGRQA